MVPVNTLSDVEWYINGRVYHSVKDSLLIFCYLSPSSDLATAHFSLERPRNLRLTLHLDNVLLKHV